MSEERRNDIELGKLIQSVETLTEQVATLTTKMEDMTAKVNTGRGMFYGALFAAGGAGAGISWLADKLFQ